MEDGGRPRTPAGRTERCLPAAGAARQANLRGGRQARTRGGGSAQPPGGAMVTLRCFMTGWSLWVLKSPIAHSTFISGM